MFDDGSPKIAIRTTDGYLSEVRGSLPDQSLTEEESNLAEDFLKQTDLKRKEEFFSDQNLKRKLLSADENELAKIGLVGINIDTGKNSPCDTKVFH